MTTFSEKKRKKKNTAPFEGQNPYTLKAEAAKGEASTHRHR